LRTSTPVVATFRGFLPKKIFIIVLGNFFRISEGLLCSV